MAGARLADASNRVVAAGVPMSAVPGVSRFWSAEAADGGRLLTWENFFLNRDTNTPVGTLPMADFADTEVSTNVVIALSAEAPRRLRFSLELEASPSNNVEVAVGCDVDGDGCLSLDESALTVGYDCEEWFVRSMAKDSVVSSVVADSGIFRRTYDVKPQNVDPNWNLVKVTRRGLAASNESVSVELVESGFAVRVL